MGKNFRLSYVIFRILLGAVIFLESINVVLRAARGGAPHPLGSHLTVLAVAEAVAAVLFLIPKTARAGGGILLMIFVFVIYVHGLRGELPLLVYAAGIAMVMVEGGTYKT
jgi:hypothetical protein